MLKILHLETLKTIKDKIINEEGEKKTDENEKRKKKRKRVQGTNENPQFNVSSIY